MKSFFIDKKYLILGLSGLLGALILAGCNKGFEQDPYADKPENIRKGVPPDLDREPPGAKPVRADALRIDTLDYYTFREGQEGEVTISGRVLQPINGQQPVLNRDFEINVENVSDFPGASFDKATGVFKWNPPRQFVTLEYTRNMTLNVLLETKTEPILSTRKSIALFVSRSEVDPEVLSAENLTTVPTREGQVTKFTVTVRDPDGLNVDNRRPRLLVVANKQGSLSASHMVYAEESTWSQSNPTQDPTDPSKWLFRMVLDTRNKELTKTKENFSFGLVAVSRFGRSSAPKAVDASIITSIGKAAISWVDEIPVYAGIENTINFSVYDLQGEGELTVNLWRCDRLPGSASCSCVNQARDGSQLCTISWKVPANQKAGLLTIEGEYLNRSKVPGDNAFFKDQFKRTVKVIPAPVAPQPQPNPQPNPQPVPNPSPGPGPTPTPTPAPSPAPTATPAPGFPIPIPGPVSSPGDENVDLETESNLSGGRL